MPDLKTESWLTVTDFRGGLRQQSNNKVIQPFSPHPTGIAAVVDTSGNPATYDCIALPEGGLGPLPFRFDVGIPSSLSGNLPAVPAEGAHITNGPGFYVGGLHVTKFNMIRTGNAAAVLTTDFSSVFVTLNAVDETAGGGAGARIYRIFRWDPYLIGITNVHEIQGTGGTTPWLSAAGAPSTFGGFSPIITYRANHASPFSPGPPNLLFGVVDPDAGGFASSPWNYPDRTPHPYRVAQSIAFIVNPPYAMPLLASHQGRVLVSLTQANFYDFDDNNFLISNDLWGWTIPNDIVLDNNGSQGIYSTFSQQYPGMFGAIASASASELILLRTSPTGGITISSDLNDPIVTDYTTLPGTNGCFINPVWTPLGLVYCSMFGSVYVYEGGGQAKDLAPYLDDGFWHQGSDTTKGLSYPGGAGPITSYNKRPMIPHLGQLAYYSGYIFFPNNWLYDITQNSWWRFRTPPDPVQGNSRFTHVYFDASPGGTIYSTPAIWPKNGGTLIASTFFKNQNASNYQWTSQLIPISQESEYNDVHEFMIEGVANTVGATYNIGITSYPDGQIELFTLTFTQAGSPQIFRHIVSNQAIRGTHVRITIAATDPSDATDHSQAAPNVYRFDLGLVRSTKVR